MTQALAIIPYLVLYSLYIYEQVKNILMPVRYYLLYFILLTQVGTSTRFVAK